MKTRWKFLNKNGRKIVSNHGDTVWRIGEWQHCDGEIKACHNGFHCSKKIYEAFSYVKGNVLAKVEVKGIHDDEGDKSAYSDMRIIEAYKWTKKDSVALAIFSAELCLDKFEKSYPDDKRPREAIDAARVVLAHDTAKNRSAARSAESAARSAESAAWSAWSAWSAAKSAAWSAESAAKSAAKSAARSAAESAVWSAESAAWSAESAAWSAVWSAWSAARSAARAKIEKFMQDKVRELKELKNE